MKIATRRGAFRLSMEAGIVAAFVHFRNSVVDVHVLKMQRGKVGYMMAIVGPQTKDSGWPVAGKN